MWHQILKARPIGVSDNFFDLGGHSLLVMRLLDAIEKEFAKQVPVAKFYECPTIEALAMIIRGTEMTSANSTLMPVQVGGDRPPLFLAGALAVDLAAHLGPQQPLYFALDRDLVNTCSSVEEMARKYLSDIFKIQPEGPYFIGGFCQWGVLAHRVAVEIEKRHHKVHLILMESFVPRYLTRSKQAKTTVATSAVPRAKKIKLRVLMRNSLRFFRRRARDVSRAAQRLRLKKRRLADKYRFRFQNKSLPLMIKEREVFRKKFPGLAMKYVPEPFHGPASMIFRNNCSILPETSGWTGVLKGAVSTHTLQFETSVKHADIFADPFADDLASVLKEVMNTHESLSALNKDPRHIANSNSG